MAEDYPSYIHHIFSMSTNSNGNSVWMHFMSQLFNDACNDCNRVRMQLVKLDVKLYDKLKIVILRQRGKETSIGQML